MAESHPIAVAREKLLEENAAYAQLSGHKGKAAADKPFSQDLRVGAVLSTLEESYQLLRKKSSSSI